MRRMVFAAALLAAGIGGAAAQQVTLGRDGDDIVLVWRDGEAMSEGYALITAGVHKTSPHLIMRLLACNARAGDKAVIIDAGFASHTIMIVGGEREGCRGDVAIEDVKR